MSPVLLLAADLLYKASTEPLPARLTAEFEGLIPILGGQEGKATVEFDLLIHPAKTELKDLLAATIELTKTKISFNDGEIPLSLESIRAFFPAEPVVFSPQGVIQPFKKPRPAPPVRLPGLDVNGLAAITFLPIELMDEPNWTFTRMINGGRQVTQVTRDGEKLKLTQNYTYEWLENEAMEVVTDPKLGSHTMVAKVTGTGEVQFSAANGTVTSYWLKTVAKTQEKQAAGTKSPPLPERALSSYFKYARRS